MLSITALSVIILLVHYVPFSSTCPPNGLDELREVKKGLYISSFVFVSYLISAKLNCIIERRNNKTTAYKFSK